MKYVAHYWKALLGFVAPGAVVIGSATLSSSAGGDKITQAEWITAVCAAVITAGAVGVKENGPKPY